MILKETKDKVSQSLGYEDWKELVKDQSNFGDAWFDLIVTNVAKISSTEWTKRGLELASERATCSDASWDAMPKYTVDKHSITDLLPELLETINKEI